MPTPQLHHYSITTDTETAAEVIAFYDAALGLKPGPRPDFGFPGYWLYAGDHPILHIIEDTNRSGGNTGFFDHIALRCEDLTATKAHLTNAGIEFFELAIESLNQMQLFIRDPAGITVELNFQQ